MIGEVSAFTHIVGGSHGWRVPDNLTYYEEWAMPRTFGVGDKLGKLFFKNKKIKKNNNNNPTIQFRWISLLILLLH